MMNVSGGMAAVTLLLAAFIAPAAMGYMDFEVSLQNHYKFLVCWKKS